MTWLADFGFRGADAAAARAADRARALVAECMAGTYAPVPSLGDLDDEEPLADDRELSQRRKVVELQNIYSANREDEHISTDEARAALDAIVRTVGRANQFIQDTKPWVLAKDDANAERLSTVLYTICESLRAVAVLYNPLMPKAMSLLWPIDTPGSAGSPAPMIAMPGALRPTT